MTELKPCPFCGSEAIDASYNEDGYMAVCSNRDCEMDGDPLLTNTWNTRPIEDALRKQLEIAVEALKNHQVDLFGYPLRW